MRRRLSLLFALSLVACGSDAEPAPETPDAAVDDGKTLRFATDEFVVPPGDTFTCFYTDVMSDRELSVYSASGSQGPGGHHIIVMYADNPRPTGYHICTDEEMTNLHQIAGAGGGSEMPPLALHDGLALKVPAGKQFVLQAHYINTGDAPQTVKDAVTLNLMDPKDVVSYVNYFVTNDDSFEIKPGQALERTTYCTLDRELQIVLTLGHMHEAGVRYQLDVVDAQDQVVQTLRDDAWEPLFTSHPPIAKYPLASPLVLTKGTRLRQTCKWNNDSARTLVFPSEMCLAFMYYFPGTGDDIVCDMETK